VLSILKSKPSTPAHNIGRISALAVAGTRFVRGRYQLLAVAGTRFGRGRYQVSLWHVPSMYPQGSKHYSHRKGPFIMIEKPPKRHIPPAPQHAASTSIRESSLKNCIQGARTSGGKVSRLVPPAVPPRCDVDPHCHTYGMLIGVRQPALRT
jgi:hypothetical protein